MRTHRFDSRSRARPRLRPVASAVALALIAWSAGAPDRAAANPTGGRVTAGAATIRQPDAATTVIDQSSARAVLDWTTFSIGARESVVFRQPGASAIALNRVVGAEPSSIFGALQANGQVFLVNPNGVLFAPGARVDVGGLVASTLGISSQDFMAGRYFFTGGAGAGSVVNHATIRAADGGYVALLGNQVTNTGTIVANRGSVALAAGNTMLLDFDGDGLLNIKVDTDAAAARIDHAGLIQADGGRVIMSVRAKNALMGTALNVEGVVNARGLVARDGAIYLDGGRSGVTSITGALDASTREAGRRGGEIRVLGEDVGLFGHAALDASGAGGGGTVLVGGDFQGANPAIPNARETIVALDARISADATARGDGGRVIVWSDETTQMFGKISARGGPGLGDGGFVEVSGKALLKFRGRVDTSAPNGRIGTLLLDPDTITIRGGAGDGDGDGSNATFFGTSFGDQGTIQFDSSRSEVYESEIEEQSKTTNIVLQAARSIVVDGGEFNYSSGNPGDQASGALALAFNRTLTLETRNSGAGETGAIDLVTGGFHGANLRIVTSAGTLTVRSGVGGNQPTPIRLPVIDTRSGNVEVHALQGGSIDTGSISTIDIANGGVGSVNLSSDGPAAGPVAVSGAITTNGFGGVSRSVTVSGSTVTVGAIDASGAASADTGDRDAGDIALTATGAAPTILLNGNLAAIGPSGTISAGAISVQGNAVLGASITADARARGTGASRDITFAGPLNADAAVNNRTLTVDAGAANVTFSGSIGNAQPLANLSVRGGFISFNAPAAQSVDVSAQGGNTVTLNGAVDLQQNLTINTAGVGTNNVSFGGAIDGDTAANNRTLTVSAGTGAVTFADSIGAVTRLANLSVTGGSIVFSGPNPFTVDVSEQGGNTVTFAGPVVLGNDLTVRTVGVATNNLSFTSSIDADNAANQRTLTLDPGAGGTVTVSGAVGAAQPLAGLTLTDSNGATFGGAVNVTQGTGTIAIANTTAGQTVSFAGNVAANTLTTAAAGYNLSLTGSNVTIGSATAFRNTGTVTLGDSGTDVLLFDGGLVTAGSATNPSSTRLGGTVRTTADPITLGPVTLIGNATVDSTNAGGSPAGANVQFRSDIDADAAASNRTLSVMAGGADVDFRSIGRVQPLADLDVAARNIVLGQPGTAEVVDASAQGANTVTFNGAVLLPADTTVTAGGNNVTFGATVDSTGLSEGDFFTLGVNSAGTTTFAGAMGGVQALRSVATDAPGTTVLAGVPITTVGSQTYNDPVVLTTGTTTLSGSVTFGSTVESPGTPQALIVSGGGTTRFGGAVGGNGNPLASLTIGAGGTTAIDGGSITTTGNQTYNGAVTLGANTTLTGATPTFASTVTGGGFDLALNFTGTTPISGSFTGIRNLSTGNGGNTTLTGTINTTGTQTYGDDVVLVGDTTVSAGANAITFAGAVSGGANLSVNSTGATTFGGAVGTGTPLTSLMTDAGGTTAINGGAITTTGNQTYNDAVVLGANATLTGATPAFGSTVTGNGFDLALNFSGTTPISGAFTGVRGLSTGNGGSTTLTGTVSTTGTQTYNDDVVLLGDATVSAGANAITFAGAVNGGFNLTVNSNGATTLGGPVGAGAPLASVTTNAGGTLLVNGGGVSTTGAQTYNDPVTLGANTALAAGGGITFANTVNGGFDLVANTPGATTFSGALGNLAPLASVTTDAGGTTLIGGGRVTTTGAQTYNDAVALGADTTLAAGAGNVAFAGTVESSGGARTLVVNTTGITTFGGAVGGGGNPLASLATDTGGTTAIDGGAITTTGNQTYSDAVTLGANTTLTGATAAFGSTLSGGGFDLALNFSGTTPISGGFTGIRNLSTGNGGNTTLTGTISTTGTQTYNDDVVLVGDATVSAGANAITFAGSVNGGFNLTANSTGATTFTRPVGAGTALASVTTDAGGTTAIDGASVTTTGAQTYNDAVTLGADTTFAAGAGNVAFAGTVESSGVARALVVNTTGSTTFGGAVGGSGNPLASLATDAGGTTAIDGGAITTTGNQIYNDAVTLGADAMLAAGAGNVAFAGTVESSGGARALVVNTTGITTFGGAVGGSGNPLASLATDAGGTTAVNGGSVTTAGNQIYNDAVTLGADTMLAAGAGNVAFAGTVESSGGARALVVSTTGITTFGGAVGGSGNTLASLTTDAGGMTAIDGGAITTTGNQTYNDAVALGADTTLAAGAGNVAFGGTVESSGGTVESSGGARALVVNTTGITTFGGAVGGSGSPLASLTTDAGGTTAINGGAITTTGDQTYNDAVTLGADTTFAAGAGTVAFAGTVESSGGARALVVNTTGITTFGGAVGGSGNPLASLTTDAGGTTAIDGGAITTTGNQTYDDAVTLGANTTLTGATPAFGSTVTGNGFDLALNFSGTTPISGSFTGIRDLSTGNGGSTTLTGTVSTTGTQTYGDDVVLVGDATVSAGANAITFAGAVNGGFSLTVNSTGATTLGGPVGASAPLTSVTTDAGGTLLMNGGGVTTSGAQMYNDPVTLGANTTLAAGGGITFAGTVSGAFDLVANTQGATRFSGALGNLAPLASVTTDAGGTTAIDGGAITTTGNQAYNDAVTLGTNTTFAAGAGNVAFGGTVESSGGARALVVNTTGITTFGGMVGGSGNPLATLTTDAGGTTAIDGGAITTTGNQTYNDAVTLGANTTLSAGGAITFGGTLNGGFDLTANTSAATTFSGAVGNLAPLAALTTDAGGTTVIGGGAVTTTGAQSYNDAVVLTGDATLGAGAAPIAFGSRIDGAFNLAVNSTGATTFTGPVGAGTALVSVTTDAGGTTAITGGAVTTTGNQTYNDAVTLGANTTLTGATPTFASTLTGGGFDLALSFSGTTAISDGLTGIRNLSTGNGGSTTLAGAIATTGTQTYNDDVVLVGDSTASAGANAITFAGAVNGGFNLTVNSGGATTLGSAVGAGAPLTSLTTDAGGTTLMNGGRVSTTGAQTYNDPVTLGANTTLTGATPTFASSVTGGGFDLALNFSGPTPISGGFTGIRNLSTGNGGNTTLTGTIGTTGTQTYGDDVALAGDATVSAGANAITFAGTVNGGFNLTVNTTGTTTFGGAVGGATPLASVTTNAGGSTVIGGGTIATSGGQTYNDPVVIASSAALTSSAGNVAFASTIDADAAANNRTLAVSAPAGEVVFSGDIGAAQPLADLDVAGGSNTIVFNASTPQTVNVTAQGGNTITFTGPVLLLQNLTVNTGGTPPNNVSFTGPVNADAAGNNRTLTFVVGTGSLGVGVVGGVPLGTFTASADTITVNGNVRARQIALTANGVTTPGGTLTALRPFTTTSDADAALTLIGLSSPGAFGTLASPLSIDASGLLVVNPSQPASLPSVYIAGTNLPVYAFSGNPAYRVVCYNGVCPSRPATSALAALQEIVSIVESPARQAALAAVLDQLRRLLDEALAAGFSRENVRRQLTQGLVLETGRARPGIDEFTGDGVAPPAGCAPSGAGQASGVLACAK